MYALSKSQGADPTLAAQYGSDRGPQRRAVRRAGHGAAEDAAWDDQNGGPRDPQARNCDGQDRTSPRGGRAAALSDGRGSSPGGNAASLLTDAQLAPIVAEAKLRWAAALGAGRLAALDRVEVMVGNLPEDRLGVTVGNLILIDLDAAGRGWFVDPTPWDDAEFAAAGRSGKLVATPANPAFGRMDLLTTVMHELGNALGFEEVRTPGNVMAETLPVGVRALAFDGLTSRTEERGSGAAEVAATAVPAVALGSAPAAAGDPTWLTFARSEQRYDPPRNGDAAASADAVTIDWGAKLATTVPAVAPAAKEGGFRSAWLSDFVTGLGQSDLERNPNAALKVSLPFKLADKAPSLEQALAVGKARAWRR